MSHGEKTIERLIANQASLTELIESGSPLVVRNKMTSVAISGRRPKIPLPDIGTRSGTIVVTGYLKGIRGGVSTLIVRCDCGCPEYTIEKQNFISLKSTRCNACAKKSSNATRKIRLGYADVVPDDVHRERLLNRLSAAIRRCHTQSDVNFHHYGGRGIFVHNGWRKDRASFLKYVITLPGWDDPSLQMDRIDVNRGYEPKNIRFVTTSENMKNRRKVEDLELEIERLQALLADKKQ